uniref:DUF3114 domain-containing protein n=1 Tax=Streptococcus canis TaxID=1329 RepID=UPI0024AE73FD|nr:DUF3114 domain-containing protein [Streptococcus canis]
MAQAILARYQALRSYQQAGLSNRAFQVLATEAVIDSRLGSSSFWLVWPIEKQEKNSKELLTFLLDLVEMPMELSGQLQDTQALLAHFSPDLAPDHLFWKELAHLVNQAFPDKSLGKEGDLERRLHQFRYVISSQQAQYIRCHYKEGDMTDGQALALFLRTKKGPSLWHRSSDYSLMDSARLHNKLKIEEDKVIFPDQELSYNIKVLLWFHTEFILDSKGFFLNEIDGEVVTEKGIVNGASFNYGTKGSRHWDLDVAPTRRHDPKFRREVIRGFRSPTRVFRRLFKNQQDDFHLSYFNAKGLYSLNHKSSFAMVKQAARQFKRQIHPFKGWF